MATKQHSTLATTQLHVSKGSADAAINTVPVSDGAGDTTWQKITGDQLAAAAHAFDTQLLHVREELAAGARGGDTVNPSAWTARALNTEVTNEISGASLASNQITLPAGTYWVDALTVFYALTISQARLRDVTSGTTLVIGTTNSDSGAVNNEAYSTIRGRFTLGGTKAIELQYYATAGVGAGLGYSDDSSADGEIMVYTSVEIWKVG